MDDTPSSLSVYLERRVITVFVLGFASGLPLALTGATLTFRLAEAGVDIAAIGFFAWVGLAYGWKFLWSPLLDRLALPPLTDRLGRRRGWLVVIQLCLIAAIVALATGDPQSGLWAIAAWAVLTAFLSASQDIVIDAYRVEILDERRQGAGAAAVTIGYRLAMLVSGAGTLVLAAYAGWFAAYLTMAALMGVGLVTTLLMPEPPASMAASAQTRADLRGWLRQAVAEPFTDFFARNGATTAALILLFIMLYKVGDALLGAVTSPLYVELGFHKTEVAAIVKTYGVVATLVGVFLGGALVRAQGLVRSLWICGVAQMVSNLVYLWLAAAGHDRAVLACAIGVENLAGGMGTAAFVAYLSSLCNLSYTATQYALLSSVMAQGRTFLAGFAGSLEARTGWSGFFVLTTLAAIPALVLLFWLQRRRSPEHTAARPGDRAVEQAG